MTSVQTATLQPRSNGPTLPVGLLGVEEEALVERADLVQGLGPHQQHRADHEVDAPTEPTESHCLHPRPEGRRERPAHPVLATPRPVHLAGCHTGQAGAGVEALLQPGDVIGGDLGVRVQQQDVAAGGLSVAPVLR